MYTWAKSIYRKIRQLLTRIVDAALIKPIRYVQTGVDPYFAEVACRR